jgi:phage gp29-like protein
VTTIPEWRKNAPAGISLAQAEKLGSGVSGPGSGAVPQTPDAKPKILPQYIRPSARDRWTSTTLDYYTPRNVENICRSAMSGNLVSQWMMFDLMEQTWPRLNKNLNELKRGVMGLNRLVLPFADKDEKPTDEAVRRAKIVDKLLRTMRPDPKRNEKDLDGTIYDVLDARGKGISVQQIVWEQRPVRIGTASSLLWTPRATQWVHPRYYGYPPGTGYDEQLMLNAREVALSNPDFQADALWIPMPEDNFMVSVFQQKSGPPVNASLLRVLGLWWAMTNFTWEWFLNFAQIFGMPIRWVTYDPATATGETITLIQQMLQTMGSSGWAAFPAGTQLELKEAMKSGADNPQKMLIDVGDMICDLAILGQTLTSSTPHAGGSRAQGQVHQDTKSEYIQDAGNEAARVISEQMVRAICRLNFNDDTECPQFVIITKANKNLVEQATRYQTLLQIPGVRISKDQFYEDNELSQPDDDAEAFVGQAPSTGQPDQEEEDPDMTGSARSALRLPCGCRGHAVASAKDASARVVDHVLENLTGVEAKWLGALKAPCHRLIALAQAGNVTDADFIAALETFQRELPGLFDKLDHAALASAMETAMAAGVVNGAVQGALARRANGGKR